MGAWACVSATFFLLLRRQQCKAEPVDDRWVLKATGAAMI